MLCLQRARIHPFHAETGTTCPKKQPRRCWQGSRRFCEARDKVEDKRQRDRRAGEFNADASQSRLLAALAWRRQLRLDELLAVPPPRHDEYMELRVRRWVGVDHEYRPVQFERLGGFLASGNVRAFTPDEWLVHYARDVEETFEKMRGAARASGAPVCGYVFCADLDGVGLGLLGQLRSVVPLLKLLTKEVQACVARVVAARADGRRAVQVLLRRHRAPHRPSVLHAPRQPHRSPVPNR